MPRKVYMPDQPRLGGGTTFHVTWDNIEEFLRGKRQPYAHLKEGERCEFVITATGINVYVIREDE